MAAWPALYSLNLTNRRFHRLTTPLLYSTFSLRNANPYRFICTIAKCPPLAAHVKTFIWGQVAEDFVILRRRVASFSPQIRTILEETTPYGASLATRIANLAYEYGEPLLNALLLFTPNVEHLHIGDTLLWDHHIYFYHPIITRTPHAFSRLRSATIEGPLQLENVIALFILPSMRSLSLNAVSDCPRHQGRKFEWEEHPGHDFATLLDKHGSNVEHFDISISHMRLAKLESPMRAFKNLKTFRFEQSIIKYVRKAAFTDANHYVDLAVLLQYQRQSLTSLRLKHESTANTLSDVLLPSIQQLGNLRELEIEPMTIRSPVEQPSPIDLLPASLEHLRLVPSCATTYTVGPDGGPDGAEMDAAMYALIDRVRTGRLPNLKSVKLEQWHPYFGYYPPSLPHLQTLFKDANVQLSSAPAELSIPPGDSPFFYPTDWDIPIQCDENIEHEWLYVYHGPEGTVTTS